MFLRGLRMIVIPLIFSSIALGVAGMGTSKSLGRIAGKTFAFYIVTTLIAAAIGLTLVNIVKPESEPTSNSLRTLPNWQEPKSHS